MTEVEWIETMEKRGIPLDSWGFYSVKHGRQDPKLLADTYELGCPNCGIHREVDHGI